MVPNPKKAKNTILSLKFGATHNFTDDEKKLKFKTQSD